jgi:hypothetical protein
MFKDRSWCARFRRRSALSGAYPSWWVRTGQRVMWSDEADAFSRSIEWTEETVNGQVERLLAQADLPDVVLDPLRGFGEPVLRGRNVTTEVLGELYRAGETVQGIAEGMTSSPLSSTRPCDTSSVARPLR